MRGLLDLPGLRCVMREEFRLVFRDVRELRFQRLQNPRMQRAARLAQQHAVGGIANERVLEEVCGIGWLALTEQKPRGDEPVEQRRQLGFAFASDRGEQCV